MAHLGRKGRRQEGLCSWCSALPGLGVAFPQRLQRLGEEIRRTGDLTLSTGAALGCPGSSLSSLALREDRHGCLSWIVIALGSNGQGHILFSR